MAEGSWVYDGATWQGGPFASMEVYDGAVWRTVTTAYVYDGATWRQFYSAGAAPTLDACDGKVCQVGGDPGCNTSSGCVNAGEQHRIGWNHTDCSDASHHVAIHVSVDGGGYTEMVDDLSCDRAEDDDGCCEFGSIKLPTTYEGNYQRQLAYSSDLGTCTTTYQYRVRIETDGTDTALDTCTEAAANTGCDTTCIL